MLQIDRWSMKQRVVALLIPFILCGAIFDVKAQEIVLKTNLISWMTTTANVGMEMKIAPKWSAEVNIMYKPWSMLSDNRKMKGFLIQPEVRYWLCQSFYKHFLGLHLHYGQYNGGFSEYRYQGDLYGAGLSYGYQWILGRNWNIEANVGLGYAKMSYDKYQRPKCGLFIGEGRTNYLGITKLSVSVVYILK